MSKEFKDDFVNIGQDVCESMANLAEKDKDNRAMFVAFMGSTGEISGCLSGRNSNIVKLLTLFILEMKGDAGLKLLKDVSERVLLARMIGRLTEED